MDEKSVFDKIKFGIEFETCFHILDHPLFNVNPFNEPEEKIEIKQAINALKNCLIHKSDFIKWITTSGKHKKNTEYNSWELMYDASVTCFKKDTCILQGKPYDGVRCEDYMFYPVEIISPVLQGNLGIRILLMVFFGVLYGDDLMYTMNETQGLHVNISHENMSVSFAKLWAFWEPIILQTIPKQRRNNTFAVPILQTIKENFGDFKNIDDEKFLELLQEKYQSLHYHPGSRYEVRIHQGTMNLYEIINWTLMIMRIMTLSITAKLPDTSNIEDYVFNFFKMLKDSELINYFSRKYNLYKDSSWPEYTYNGPIVKLYTTKITDLPIEVQKGLSDLRKRKCGSEYIKEQKDIQNLFENKEVNFKREMSMEDFVDFFSERNVTFSDLRKIKNILSHYDYITLVNKVIFPKNINAEEIIDYFLAENILDYDNVAKYIIKKKDQTIFKEFLEKIKEKDRKEMFILEVVAEAAKQDEKKIFDKIYEEYNINFRDVLFLANKNIKSYYADKILQKSTHLTPIFFKIIFKKYIHLPIYVEQLIRLFAKYAPKIMDCKLIKDLIDIVLTNNSSFLAKSYIPSLIDLSEIFKCGITYNTLKNSLSPEKWKLILDTLL